MPNKKIKRESTENELEETFEDFNQLLERAEKEYSGSESESGSEHENISENENSSEELSRDTEKSEEESDASAHSDADEELLRLDELNNETEEIKPSQKKEDLTSTYRLLAVMHKDGPSGTLSAESYEFLSSFNLENTIEVLEEKSKSVIGQVEAQFKILPEYKRMNKQKPLKQRIKLGIAEKLKKNLNGYSDIPFIIGITKDFCYKTGTKIYNKKPEKRRVELKVDERKVYEKLVGFCSRTGEYAWSEEKNDEFVKCVFKE
ncbi:hypothetical protein NEMIN01_0836 [Nematocida minor]|uniref:uncharacterized protein n=1 Tax=Nematocida minor TaxID=1912983 RepID=UPI00222034CD|nr:uncharacterized protein NEMIN01_0836 [Nematocida minor]KAI5190051.1 hypothetical protein NEMIN01_0836 [Nematocida minor]